MSSKRVKTVRIKKPKTQQEKKMATIARSQALKVVNKNIESKIFDARLPSAGTNVDYNGVLYDAIQDLQAVTTITQGAGQSQYIGEKIRPTHISLRWSVVAADPTNLVTCVLLQAKGSFVPGATMANILESTGNSSAPLSPFDKDYDDRFRVLYRKTMTVNTYEPERVYKVNIPYNKLSTITYNDAAGTVEAGVLMIGWISDSSSSTHPLVRANWRIFYKDA